MHLQGDWDQVFAGHAKAMDGGDSSKAALAPSVCDCVEGDRCCWLGNSKAKCCVIAG